MAANMAAAIAATPADSPSMLSSMLNELISPTIHSTLSAPVNQGASRNSDIRQCSSNETMRGGHGGLHPQPQPPVELPTIVGQAQQHQHRPARQQLPEFHRLVQQAGNVRRDGAGQRRRKTHPQRGLAHGEGQHDAQPNRQPAGGRHGRRVDLPVARLVDQSEPRSERRTANPATKATTRLGIVEPRISQNMSRMKAG